MKSGAKGVIAGAVVICIVLFIGMCLFIGSFSIVEPTYMAITRNTISSVVDKEKIYFEGRHFIGVANEFITFPMAWQLIEYTDDEDVGGKVDYVCKVEDTALDAGTSEGLRVTVEVSVYFSISPDQLVDFYTTYNTNYQDSIANECKRVLKDTVAKFKYEELFKGRLNITKAMTTELNKALSRRRCILQKLLLRGIGFTKNLENKIEESVIADQAKAQNEYRSQISKIVAETESLRKSYSFLINEVIAAANSNATIITEEARAYSVSVLAQSTATAWQKYQSITELEPAELLRVQWARALGSASKADSLALGYDKIGSKFVQNVHDV